MSQSHTTSEACRETLRYAEGLFTGQLNDQEMEAFNLLCANGYAHREYNFLGLAKVRIHPTDEEQSHG